MTKLGPIPHASSSATRNVMRGNRGKDTQPEISLRAALTEKGLTTYMTDHRLGGYKVDIAFPERKVAILVNGCFWHHCQQCNPNIPSAHRGYWRRKFELTKARDEKVRLAIRGSGWTLIEVWEHDIEADLVACVSRVVDVMRD